MSELSSIVDGSIAAVGMLASLVVSVWALMDSHPDRSLSSTTVDLTPDTLPRAA